ncbi:SecY-interacting protein [Parendozoicomonas sp. Alg238-R29]|uniref:SecY-interacting protein n=1 Tax=Parendozoicomonas sp. Alg238-R29 TaxID=2993446 RepID=UPI00248E561A|nr:SecY-interacting protein [Parendozoicomonas sp. Alg238-R29]
MKDVSPATQQALTQLHNSFREKNLNHSGTLPVCDKDPEWPSPCEQAHPDLKLSYWEAVSCPDTLDFSGLETALGLKLHPDIASYYTSFYSNNIPVCCDDGNLELLQVWNRDDFDRLQQNLIGHLMMKKKRKQNPTVFFAVTDDDEIILSVLNETGEVWAERVGKNPHRKMANNLAEFLENLTV